MEHCPRCQTDVTADRQAGKSSCTRCGAALPPGLAFRAPAGTVPSPGAPPEELPPPPPTPGERALLRAGFWLLLLLPPLAVAALVAKPGSGLDVLPAPFKMFLHQFLPLTAQILGIAGTGALGAAYCLTRLHTNPARLANSINIIAAYTLAILFLDLCLTLTLAFVGCLLGRGP